MRPAQAGDIPAITAIYRDAVLYGTATFDTEPPDAAEMARRLAALTDAGFPYLAVEEGGDVLGSGYVAPYRRRPAYRWTVENSIYLAEGARGRGIGGALLRRLIDMSERLGFRQMVAVIGDSENVASIRLHRAAGFDEVGVLADVGYKHGRWLDTVMMELPLGAGSATLPEA